MSAPERVWAAPPIGGTFMDGSFLATADDLTETGWPKYTRTDLIPAMIQAAVDAEREACAMVAEHQHKAWVAFAGAYALVDDDVSACANIAAAIRARKGGAE